MKKKFFIFEVDADKQVDGLDSLRYVELIEGTVTEARDVIKSEAYEAGNFLILEDTSGIVKKATETITKTAVTFEPTRKRPRNKEKVAK